VKVYQETKRQWMLGFMEQGINSQAMIENGLRHARASGTDFLPSVGKFVKWCREEAAKQIGLPSIDQAFSQLHKIMGPRDAKRDWSQAHPAVYWAYRNMDWFLVSQKPETEQRMEFLAVWEEARRLAGEGFVFPAPPIALEELRGEKAPADVIKKSLGNLKALFDD
jgi:hypothetical protein